VTRPSFLTLNWLVPPTWRSINSEAVAEVVSVTFNCQAVNVTPTAFHVTVDPMEFRSVVMVPETRVRGPLPMVTTPAVVIEKGGSRLIDTRGKTKNIGKERLKVSYLIITITRRITRRWRSGI